MRFERIEIKNFRQYESMILEFPKGKSTDLHVVIASNGIGKTNLLNSIDWCLYGEESHLGDKNESLSICNLKAIDTAKRNNEAVAQVSVKIFAHEKDVSIQFVRVVPVNPNTLIPGIEQFKVFYTPATGNTKILEDEEAARLVDSYLPKKIKQYFFFDGEQLYNYFGQGQDTTHVKDSIHEIAQVNVVTHVREHLDITISDKQKEIAKLNPDTERLQKELEDLIENKISRENDIEQLSSQVIDADDLIDDLNQKISGTESVAEDDRRYKWVQNQISEFEEHKKELDEALSALVRKYYILLMLFDINTRTNEYINDKKERGHLPPDINKELLLQSINHGKCAICQQSIDDNVKKHLNELIQKFEVSTSVSNKLMEIKNDVAQACIKASSYEIDKEKIYKDLRETESKISDLEDEAEVLYKRISTCSSVDQIEDWMEQREQAKHLRDVNKEKIGSYKKECSFLEQKIELKNEQIDNATKGEHKCSELKSQLLIAKEACSIVKEIEDEIITEIREKMEKETFDIFSQLIWKTNTYGKIELSKDYRLRLFHVHGDSCLGSCSAAERELLALAFTLALHRVSHHDSLLFIDTPVGRVSDDNRECFAKSLIDVSQSKQLILAFTPSEYSVEISKYFDNAASSCTHLGTPDETATIRIGG